MEGLTEEDSRPVVCVDLNGVLDAYTGWRGPHHWDPPRPGAEEFLRSLCEQGFRVVIHTTRWADDARGWLESHGLDRWVSEITDRKPAAHVFVDDRAVCFRGDFGATLEEVVRFRAHWEAAPATAPHTPPPPAASVPPRPDPIPAPGRPSGASPSGTPDT